MATSELTESAYALVVLAYATVATTNFLFATPEEQARVKMARVQHLRENDCKHLWSDQDQNGHISAGQAKKRHILEEYDRLDTLRREHGTVVRRWQWCHRMLFVIVFYSSAVLLSILGIALLADPEWAIYPLKVALFLGGLIAVGGMVLVTMNLLDMGKGVKSVDNLLERLENVALGGHLPEPPASDAPPGASA